MKIIKQYLTENDCYRSGRIITPTHIQVHSIGTPQPKATALMSYWNQPGVEQMVHALIQAGGTVYEIMEQNKRSWADAGYGNDHAITFEMMEPDTIRYTNGADFIDEDPKKTKEYVTGTYKTAVAYSAYLCKKYSFDPVGKTADGIPVIFTHNEGRLWGISSAHVDPNQLWDKFDLTIEQFRKDVAAAMENENKPLEKGMKVRTINDIYWRTGVSEKEQQAGYVKYENLSDSARKKSIKVGIKAKFKKNNVVKILEVKTAWDGNVWIRVKNGWLPVVVKGKSRVQVVS